MKKYYIRIAHHEGEIEKEINSAAKKGWKLITLTPYMLLSGYNAFIIVMEKNA